MDLSTRRIPASFRKNGYDYTQVQRNNNIAVYKQEFDNTLIGFEVVELKVAEATTLFGKDVPRREVYPSNEDWGTLGFTVKTIGEAIKRFELLTTKVKERDNG